MSPVFDFQPRTSLIALLAVPARLVPEPRPEEPEEDEGPDAAILRQMMLAAPPVAPLSEDETWLDDLPSVIAAIDEDDLLRGIAPQAINSQ